MIFRVIIAMTVLCALSAASASTGRYLAMPLNVECKGTWVVRNCDAINMPTPRFLSSLAEGEQGVGSILSPAFTLSTPVIRLSVRGWDGLRGDGGKNRIELIDDATSEILRTVKPPSSDRPKWTEWKVDDLKGRRVCLRLIDDDRGNGYAWMGLDEVDAGTDFTAKFAEGAGISEWRGPAVSPSTVQHCGIPFLVYPSSAITDGQTVDIQVGIHTQYILLLGMNTPSRSIFVGDKLGSVRVRYATGDAEDYPLIVGESLWWGSEFTQYPEPFISVKKARAAFNDAMRLYLADPKKSGRYLAVIKPRVEKVESIEFIDSPEKGAAPVILGLTIVSQSGEKIPGALDLPAGKIPADLVAHLEKKPLRREDADPEESERKIRALQDVMYCTSRSFPQSFSPDIPKGYDGPRVRFGGDVYAGFYTNMFHHNVWDMAQKVDEQGIYRTSTKGAPWYGYNGFGTFTKDGRIYPDQEPGFYYQQAWTRDMGRSLQELIALGYLDKAKTCADWVFKMARVWEEGDGDHLKLNGHRLPRHIHRMLQWPNTMEGFGCFENDGHGLSSLFIYNLWRRLPERDRWLRDHWRDVQGLGDWVVWQLENPEVSRATDVLWSDSEGSGWDQETGSSVFCDVACIEALRGLADMADSIGQDRKARLWRNTADRLKTAGEKRYIEDDPELGKTWTLKKSGWGGQSTLGPLIIPSDRVGFAPEEDDLGWRSYDKAAYTRSFRKFALSAMGYGSGFSIEAALLLDRIKDATHMLQLTAKGIYNPSCMPYIVPEIAWVNDKMIARGGDLGNGVQQAEMIKALRIITGIDDSHPSELRLLPRLPGGWNHISVKDYPVLIERDGIRETAHIDYTLSRTEKSMTLKISSDKTLPGGRIRLGPFDTAQSQHKALLNGQPVSSTFEQSGDSGWLRIETPPGTRKIVVEIKL